MILSDFIISLRLNQFEPAYLSVISVIELRTTQLKVQNSKNSENTTNLFSRENIADHARQTLCEMWKYAKEELFCDVILVAELDGKKIPAHRPVLSAVNEFFQTMFRANFKEANTKEVIISDVSGDILKLLVEYCYTGRIHINEDNAQLLLPQASYLLFPEIVEACSVFQIASINPGNCLSLIKYAKLYNCEALLENAEEHLKEHFENVAVTEEFLKLTQAELEECLSLDELTVENEKIVFDAMMRWIDHDLQTRSGSLSKLLPLIRLHQIENNYLLQYVVKTGSKNYYLTLLNGIQQHFFNAQVMPARTGSKPNRIVVVCTKKIQIYNPEKNVFECNYSIPKCGSFVPVLFGEKIILVGSRKVRCFNLHTNTWHELASTLTDRSDSSVAILKDYVYAVGGSNKKSIERWDSKLNRWNEVASMNHERFNHCTVSLNGKLYAIGGYVSGRYLNSVECYDPNTDQWSVCSPMLKTRGYTRAVVVNNEIFVFGGRNDSSLKCIEKYNPKTNTWNKVSEMIYNRRRMGTYLFNKKIYLLGGYDGEQWFKSMEEFDPETNECKLISIPNITYVKDLYCFPYLSKTNHT